MASGATFATLEVVRTRASTALKSTAHVCESPGSRRWGRAGPIKSPTGCNAMPPGLVTTFQDVTVTGRRPTLCTCTVTTGCP